MQTCTSAEHMETCTGRKMAPVLRKLDDADELAAYKEKVRKLPEKLKAKTKVLARARAKKRVNSKKLPCDKIIASGKRQLWFDLVRACPALQRYLVPVVPGRVCCLLGDNHQNS